MIILNTLASPKIAIPGAAELAVDFMYSAALSPVANAYLYGCIGILYCQNIMEDGESVANAVIPTRGAGALHVIAQTEDMKEFLKMPLSTYGFDEAMENMRSAMLHPSRVDYRDRHLASLTPGHRMAWTHHKQTGVLAPFSTSTSDRTEPNRFFFFPLSITCIDTNKPPGCFLQRMESG